MRNICLVNGSLRGKNAASLEFLKDIDRRIPGSEYSKTVITVSAKVNEQYPESILKSLAGADAIIFIFPLHNYGLPGALMRLLEDYHQYVQHGNIHQESSVYVIINCAFPRPERTCGEAIRVMHNVCRRLTLKWRGALCIGTGPVVVMTKKIPFLYPGLKKAYSEIISDIRAPDEKILTDYFIKPILPESVIAAIKRYYEKKGKMIVPDNKSRQVKTVLH